MGCGVVEATGQGFVCFVAIPRLLSADRVDFGLFVSLIFQFYSPPPPHTQEKARNVHNPAMVVTTSSTPIKDVHVRGGG